MNLPDMTDIFNGGLFDVDTIIDCAARRGAKIQISRYSESITIIDGITRCGDCLNILPTHGAKCTCKSRKNGK